MLNRIPLSLFCLIQSISYSQDAEVVDYKTDVMLINNKLHTSISKVIQINNRNGEKYCDILIPFKKSNKILNLEASIEDTSGNLIRTLKKVDYKDVSNISNFSLFEDDYVRKFTLKHNYYPYRIKYSYKTIYKDFIEIENWQPVDELDLPILNAQLIVDCPINMELKIINKNITQPVINILNDRKIITCQTTYSGKLKREIFCGDINDYLPSSIIIPENFIYGIVGSTKNWIAFGDYFYKLGVGLDDLPELDKAKIIALTSHVTSTSDKVKILYNYLQSNFQYINVSVKLGGLIPYPASYVAKNKYGDCKALSSYMQTLLKTCNIDSYYSLVYSGFYPPNLTKDTVIDKFNHAILCVPVEGDTIWLENTSGTIPMGYVGTSTQNRMALIIKEGASHLEKLPKLNMQNVLNERTISTTISNSEVTVNATILNRAYNYELTNSFANYLNNNEQEKYISDIVSIQNSSINNWEIKNNIQDSAKNQLTLTLTLPYTSQTYGKDVFLNPFPFSLPQMEKPQLRKLPVIIPYPIHLIDTIKYSIEQNSYELINNNVIIENKYGKFNSNVIKTDSTIILIKELIINSNQYSLDEYPDFYEFINQIDKANRTQIRLKETKL
jgi:hypothetical protein